jgi:hypothetical protein
MSVTPHEPEFVPVALACGHVIQGVAHFDTGPPSRVECQEGCGWQEYVIEPDPYVESARPPIGGDDERL